MPAWPLFPEHTCRTFERALVPTPATITLFAGLSFAYFLSKATTLPRFPSIVSDSESYLSFGNFRPPGYYTFLVIHKILFGGMEFLPHVQLFILFLSVFLLSISVAALSRNILAAFVVLLVSIKFAPWQGVVDVMSDTLFTALVVSGAAAISLYGAAPRRWLLWVAAFLLASAAMVRTVGDVVLIAFALTVAFLALRRQLSWRSALMTLVPVAAVFLAATLATYAHLGQLGIRSTGGLSILGKGLLVAERLPPGDDMSRFNWIAAEVQPAQESLARAADLPLRMLMVRQYYECLRFGMIMPELEVRWPEWRAASPSERGVLAAELSKAYIRAAPVAYARLAALDYAALWAVPHMVTTDERAYLVRRWKGLGDMAFLPAWERRNPGEYSAVIPSARSNLWVWAVRVVSALFLVSSVVCPLLLLISCPKAVPTTAPAIVFISLAVHLSYLATALNEAGLERYVAPFWPLMAPMIALVPTLISQTTVGGRREPHEGVA